MNTALFQTGLSGNIIMLSVLYSGGMMMTGAQISVGDLTSFLLYAGFVGISFGGNKKSICVVPETSIPPPHLLSRWEWKFQTRGSKAQEIPGGTRLDSWINLQVVHSDFSSELVDQNC